MSEKKLIYFWSKIEIYLSSTYVKDVQTTKEASSPQKKTSSTQGQNHQQFEETLRKRDHLRTA